MRTVTQRVVDATRRIGDLGMAGWCEKFVRTCFGFPARYPSALLAWNATKRRHSSINAAPAGVPIFWRLHPANPNYGLGHVALSVGGGYCISTSVGPGGAIGKVRIADLTRAWGMTPLGWTEDYHGRTVWTPPTKTTPKTPVTPLSPEEDEMTPAQEAKLNKLLELAEKNNHALGRIDPGKGKTLLGEITGSRPLSDDDVAYLRRSLDNVKAAIQRTEPGKGKQLLPEIRDLLTTIETQED